MKKNILLFSIVMFFISSNIRSQEISLKKDFKITKSSVDIKKTIQILFLTSEKNDPIGLTSDLINQIEVLRHETKITYLDINKGCKIKILPKNIINQKDFKPMEEFLFVEKFE